MLMAQGTRLLRCGPGFVLSVVLLAGALAIAASAPRESNRAEAAAATPAASPVSIAQETIIFDGLVAHRGPVSVSQLQQLPQETVAVTFESGNGTEKHSFTGVRLYDALDKIGLVVDPNVKNPLLRMYLVITANDGYQVVISGGEIDPNFGHAPMLLAWEQDGAPLAGEDGPLRLVVPGDLHGGRYVHGIVSIDVRSIDESS
jgi:DMSO/TMAO reductase YedYZ molybdopterin-dependent catalytic subunit